MKLTIIALLMAGAVMAGCGRVEAMEDAVENQMDRIEDRVESAMTPDQAKITADEAKAIALEHAGFTEDQVTYLRADYEIDDGVPQYEVDFHQGGWEYEYEINAENGSVISNQRED